MCHVLNKSHKTLELIKQVSVWLIFELTIIQLTRLFPIRSKADNTSFFPRMNIY